jgi:hypothetical protein
MAVSGAPEYTPQHAENVADVALSLLRHVKQLKLPSGIRIQIRIGKISCFAATRMEIPVLWNVAPRSVIKNDRRFRDA